MSEQVSEQVRVSEWVLLLFVCRVVVCGEFLSVVRSRLVSCSL